MDVGLRDKRALVTGASGIIGGAVAQALAAEGVDVALCGRDTRRLETAAAAVEGEGRRALTLQLDLATATGAQTAVDSAVAAWGGLDILINVAGASRFGDPLKIDDGAFEEAMQLKFMGYLRTSRAAAQVMIRAGGGAIVNVVGVGGIEPTALHLPGSCANAAILAFTKGFGRELATHNIRVNAVSPAAVATPRWEKLLAANAERDGVSIEEMRSRMNADLPIGRPITPAEVADAVVFVVSDRAASFVAAHLVLDGGSIRAV